MSGKSKEEWFEGIETIVKEPLKFKACLAIGEDAYTTLRLKNRAFELWDVAGVAGSAAVFAKSSTIASTFFTSSGFLGLSIFSTAATPLPWIVAASVLAGGGWLGITRYLKQSSHSKVTVIPNFINTPMDVLALGLFDLMAPLALKVALIDGEVHASEKNAIQDYFVKKWGYEEFFVREGLNYIEGNISDFSIKNVAQSLAEFKKQNKDCNAKKMSLEIIRFLTEIIEQDGRIDEREEMAIESVKKIFKEIDRFSLKRFSKDRISSAYGITKKFSPSRLIPKKKKIK